MRIKTIIIILITAILTIILVQNNTRVNFDFLWATFAMSKLVMLLIVAVIAFVLGILVGRPNKIKRLGGDWEQTTAGKSNTSTLSDDDKEYIA
jgi:uncharacterized integral membrane protein